jgi:regulatory protein
MSEEENKTDTHRAIRNSITRFLARREHSFVELVAKLKQKEYELEDIEQVLQEFTNRNLQSDLRYAQSYVRTAYYKGKGPSFIEQSLQQHDIDSGLVKSLLKDEDYDWFEAASQVRIKRFGEPIPSDWDDIQKQKRFLQYRGFYQVHIKEVFST